MMLCVSLSGLPFGRFETCCCMCTIGWLLLLLTRCLLPAINCRYYTPAWESADPYAHKGAVGRGSLSRSTSSGRSSKSTAISSSSIHASKFTSSDGNSVTTGSGDSGSRPLTAQLHDLLKQWQHKKPCKQGNPWWQQQHLQSLPTALNPYKSYYSFSMATVHFLMLDSESPSHKGSPQHSFVLQDLAKVGR